LSREGDKKKNMTSSKEQVAVDKKKGYLWNELRSLGIEPIRNTELNDDEELQQLAGIIELSMYQDYKMAFSMNGEKHEEEAQSTIN
jgi:hypothetical protein